MSESLESLLSQTYSDLEVIVSDNASTDGTQGLCESFARRDPRVRYYRETQNTGAAANYNRVFHLARGEYFKWAAHDDLCAPTLIDTCVEALDREPQAVLAYTHHTVIDEDAQEIERVTEGLPLRDPSAVTRFTQLLRRFRRNTVHCDAVFGVMRTDVLRDTPLIGPYPTSDLCLLAELSLRGQFLEVDDFLFTRRRHPRMSTLAHPTPQQRAVWFDPSNRGRVVMPRWRWLREFIQSINRVDITTAERWQCYAQTLGWCWSWRRAFAGDLVRGLAQRWEMTPGLSR